MSTSTLVSSTGLSSCHMIIIITLIPSVLCWQLRDLHSLGRSDFSFQHFDSGKSQQGLSILNYIFDKGWIWIFVFFMASEMFSSKVCTYTSPSSCLDSYLEAWQVSRGLVWLQNKTFWSTFFLWNLICMMICGKKSSLTHLLPGLPYIFISHCWLHIICQEGSIVLHMKDIRCNQTHQKSLDSVSQVSVLAFVFFGDGAVAAARGIAYCMS